MKLSTRDATAYFAKPDPAKTGLLIYGADAMRVALRRQEVIKALEGFPTKISASLDKFRFREALSHFIDLARLGNKYLAETEPWKLIKTDKTRTATILNVALQIAANLSLLSEPFLPKTAKRLGDMLKLTDAKWEDAGSSDLLQSGMHVAVRFLLCGEGHTTVPSSCSSNTSC